MDILKNAVYFQLCFGFPYIVNVDSDARLFEYAFGILFEESIVGGDVETCIVIDEPFIIQTAYNLLSEHSHNSGVRRSPTFCLKDNRIDRVGLPKYIE